MQHERFPKVLKSFEVPRKLGIFRRKNGANYVQAETKIMRFSLEKAKDSRRADRLQ